MRITTIALALFLLSAFAVGVSMQDGDIGVIENALDNASKQSPFENITVETDNKYTDGMVLIIFDGAELVFKAGIQVMRLGILFGYENPDYFTPEYVLKIVKLLLILTIISLLIKPLFYVGAFLVIFIMWLLERIKTRKEKKLKFKSILCKGVENE